MLTHNTTFTLAGLDIVAWLIIWHTGGMSKALLLARHIFTKYDLT